MSASRPRHRGPVMRLAFVALALGALVLGYIGLHEYLSSRPRYGTGVLDLVYWDLQLFVLDSAPLQDGGELPLTLQFRGSPPRLPRSPPCSLP